MKSINRDDHVKKIENLNNAFEAIKYDAFAKYTTFDAFLSRSHNYCMRLNSRIFSAGGDMFKILPVGTITESATEDIFKTFDGTHSSKLYCRELINIIEIYNLPSKLKSPAEPDGEGATEAFKFGYMLSAVLCNKIGALSFASVCPNKGMWVWFVVIECSNEDANLSLNFSNMSIDYNFTIDQRAKEWYDYMKIGRL